MIFLLNYFYSSGSSYSSLRQPPVFQKTDSSETVTCNVSLKPTATPEPSVITKHHKVPLVPGGFVGFASLPDQVYRKSLRKGFEFSLMVVGESGLGKSTLVNSMFMTDIYNSKENVICPDGVEKTVRVENHHVVLEEGGVKLSLNVVDTPGKKKLSPFNPMTLYWHQMNILAFKCENVISLL